MTRMILRAVLFLTAIGAAFAQQVIPLSNEGAVTSEKQYFSKIWNTEVVTNVTQPSLTLYRPVGGGNGTAIVICPGGGFMALSINSEGIDVAKWLAERGVTAFVLKYRLAHTGEDATAEFMTRIRDWKAFEQYVEPAAREAVHDGLAAVAYVKAHAADWQLKPDRVGIIGFSAGGTVAAGVTFHYSADNRPAFVASIYGGAEAFKDNPVPPDAPPVFLVAASDDQLGLNADSVTLYSRWTAAKKSAELHIYSAGGHGFGMKRQGYPSDSWIDRFSDWLSFNGWMKR